MEFLDVERSRVLSPSRSLGAQENCLEEYERKFNKQLLLKGF